MPGWPCVVWDIVSFQTASPHLESLEVALSTCHPSQCHPKCISKTQQLGTTCLTTPNRLMISSTGSGATWQRQRWRWEAVALLPDTQLSWLPTERAPRCQQSWCCLSRCSLNVLQSGPWEGHHSTKRKVSYHFGYTRCLEPQHAACGEGQRTSFPFAFAPLSCLILTFSLPVERCLYSSIYQHCIWMHHRKTESPRRPDFILNFVILLLNFNYFHNNRLRSHKDHCTRQHASNKRAVVTSIGFSLTATWKSSESHFLSKCALLCSLPLSGE